MAAGTITSTGGPMERELSFAGNSVCGWRLPPIVNFWMDSSLKTLQTPPQPNAKSNMVNAGSLVKKTSMGHSLLLILALCFHSVFEGIAIDV